MPRLKRATIDGEQPTTLFEDSQQPVASKDDDRPGDRPLADRMRPKTLNELVGQQKIVGQGRALRKMIEEDQYFVDILKQTYAVEKAIHKLEAVLVEGHLQSCVPEGFQAGRSDDMIRELTELYAQARR